MKFLLQPYKVFYYLEVCDNDIHQVIQQKVFLLSGGVYSSSITYLILKEKENMIVCSLVKNAPHAHATSG